MKKINLLLTLGMLSLLTFTVQAQEAEAEKNPLVITGSVDLYYKYDFSGEENIPTSFANEQNTMAIGMVDIGLAKEVGRASFVGEIAFGPRNAASVGPSSSVVEPNIQNLYISYALTDKLSVTAGYMGTFVGYEVISPTGNFNYSTSYMFTNGPFQNAGVKLEYAFSDRVALMAGLFNNWNVYSDTDGMSDFGAQLYLMPTDGWDLYLNFVSGSPSGTEVDITTGYQLTDAFYLGLNMADYSASDEDDGGFSGAALYAQYAITDAFSLGGRYEYFSTKDFQEEAGITTAGTAYNAFTVSGNLKAGPLTFIPELRIDTSSDNVFADGDSGFAKTASQILFAAVYAF